jgi:hypothetical protein
VTVNGHDDVLSEFAAQLMNEHRDGVALDGRIVAVDDLLQILARNDATGPLEQREKRAVLMGAQGHLFPTARDDAFVGLHAHIAAT